MADSSTKLTKKRWSESRTGACPPVLSAVILMKVEAFFEGGTSTVSAAEWRIFYADGAGGTPAVPGHQYPRPPGWHFRDFSAFRGKKTTWTRHFPNECVLPANKYCCAIIRWKNEFVGTTNDPVSVISDEKYFAPRKSSPLSGTHVYFVPYPGFPQVTRGYSRWTPFRDLHSFSAFHVNPTCPRRGQILNSPG